METSSPIKATVLLPVYNAGKYLTEAISSILNQSYQNFELLIINDASTDQSEKIIQSFSDNRIRLINNEKNLGLAQTLNRGLQLSKGEYIVRMDQDDINLEKRIKTQIDYLENHPDVSVLGCGARMVGPNLEFIREPKRPQTNIQNKWKLLFGTTILHPSAVFRKEIILKHGGYSQQYPHCEEFDLWSRLYDFVDFHQIPQVLVFLRKHNTNSGVIYKDISTENFIEISVTNIMKLPPLNHKREDVLRFVKWNRGVAENLINNKEICKILFSIYFAFVKKNKISKSDLSWVTNNFISMLTPALFKIGLFTQVSLLGISILMSISLRIFNIDLYSKLIRKYLSSFIS